MARHSYPTISSLEKQIKARAGKALKNEVANYTTNKLKEHIQKDVYDTYNPVMYERRKEDGGLMDDGNIRKVYRAGKLNVYEEASPASSDGTSDTPQSKPDALALIIEQGAKNPQNHYHYKWMEPRPFVSNTQDEINRNPTEILEMIKKRIEHDKQ